MQDWFEMDGFVYQNIHADLIMIILKKIGCIRGKRIYWINHIFLLLWKPKKIPRIHISLMKLKQDKLYHYWNIHKIQMTKSPKFERIYGLFWTCVSYILQSMWPRFKFGILYWHSVKFLDYLLTSVTSSHVMYGHLTTSPKTSRWWE